MNKLLCIDQKYSAAIQEKWSQIVPFQLSSFLAHSGDSWFWCIFLFIPWLFTTGQTQETLAFWGLSIALTAVLIFLIKRIIRRPRPNGEWGEIYRKTDPHSFPSGHAVRGGLIVMLAWGTLGANWATAALLWALLMILARVATGVHYLLDILVGFVIGLGLGFVLIQTKTEVVNTLPFLFDRTLWRIR